MEKYTTKLTWFYSYICSLRYTRTSINSDHTIRKITKSTVQNTSAFQVDPSSICNLQQSSRSFGWHRAFPSVTWQSMEALWEHGTKFWLLHGRRHLQSAKIWTANQMLVNVRHASYDGTLYFQREWKMGTHFTILYINSDKTVQLVILVILEKVLP